jgi:hypothetical protein
MPTAVPNYFGSMEEAHGSDTWRLGSLRRGSQRKYEVAVVPGQTPW